MGKLLSMQNIGRVVRIDGDVAFVEGERRNACGSCAGQGACGTLGGWFKRRVLVQALNEVGAKVGDEVVIELGERELLKAAWRLYGLPAVLFALAAVATSHLVLSRSSVFNDVLSFLAACATMGLYFFRLHKRRDSRNPPAKVVRVVSRVRVIPITPS